jgi:hypothetical protein
VSFCGLLIGIPLIPNGKPIFRRCWIVFKSWLMEQLIERGLISSWDLKMLAR